MQERSSLSARLPSNSLTSTRTQMPSQQLYQVYDNVAQRSMGPIIAAYAAAAAIRSFTDAMKDERTTLAQHPEDFDLLHLGEQDEHTGTILGVTPTIVLAGSTWAVMNSGASPRTPAGADNGAVPLNLEPTRR